MIVISGSWLVKDSEKRNDVDVVYLTWDVGKYIVLLIRKKKIENELGKKLGIKVSFSPYIIVSPTILGNIFLAITLLRYPFYKYRMKYILKLVTKKRNKRWLLLHFAFAMLGLLSANSLRDYAKYCSMIAENLLYIENRKIPNSWRDTIRAGYIMVLKRKLHNLSDLFSYCIEDLESKHKHTSALNTPSLFINATEEYLKLIGVRDVEELLGGVDNAFRRIHEIIVKHLFGYSMRWQTCSSIIIAFMHPKILAYAASNPEIRTRIAKIFALCKKQIPVLSPLAHP